MKYEFREASGADEFEQIFRLNYRVFVEELGQYSPNADHRLIDKFHARNRYFVAVCESRVVGMIATHDQPPFSIEQRLTDPSVLEPLKQPSLEVRLLAIDPGHRSSMVLAGLFGPVYEFARSHHFGTLLMSGVADRLSLYRKLGFRALGPPMAYGCVEFVPMALNLDDVPDRLVRRSSYWRSKS